MIMKMVLLTVVGLILALFAECIRNNHIQIKWLKKLWPFIYIVAFILIGIGTFTLKKNAYENDWWWLL